MIRLRWTTRSEEAIREPARRSQIRHLGTSLCEYWGFEVEGVGAGMGDGLAELTAMQAAYEAIKELEPDQQRRAVGWLIDTLGLTGLNVAAGRDAVEPKPPLGGGGDGDRELNRQGVSPKEFIRAKKPTTTAERLACLAYYLTHVRATTMFKTPDLVAVNTEAAGPRIANASRDVDNADRGSGYLVSAGGGSKQISARGEALVEALPDRDAVKQALEEHPHRRRVQKTKSSGGRKKGTSERKVPSKKTLPKA